MDGQALRTAGTEGLLGVGDGQLVHWTVSGNPEGRPVVVLHGGPGGGARTGPGQFDPAVWRVVRFDQRGCGSSTPWAGDVRTDLSVNTTQHLIGDIEALREHLGVDRWLVNGGSWGVTLALVYAQTHPDRVTGLLLSAVTSGERRETDWITRDMGRVFPAEWDRFVSLLPDGSATQDIPAAYAALLADPDPAVRERAARSWCDWEDTHVRLMPGWEPSERYRDPHFRMQFARLVTHYWGHGCFLAPGQVRAGMPRIADIPAVLIHGRYDVSGPLDTAWELHRRWPASRLVVLEGAGHGGTGFAEAARAAIRTFRDDG
jgi:proline iminopeptidase